MDSGYIYIIHAIGTEYYKIGLTRNHIEHRLRQLQTGCPHRLEAVYSNKVDDVEGVEAYIHDVLSNYRTVGEWFELPSLSTAIMAANKALSEYTEYNDIQGSLIRVEMQVSVSKTPKFIAVNEIASTPHMNILLKIWLCIWAIFLKTEYQPVHLEPTKYMEDSDMEAFYNHRTLNGDSEAPHKCIKEY